MKTLPSATEHQEKPAEEEFIFDTPRKAPDIASGMAWDKIVRSFEVPPLVER